MKKVFVEKQKFLEGSKREKTKNKIFISGIPEQLSLDDEGPLTGQLIIPRILSFAQPTIVQAD